MTPTLWHDEQDQDERDEAMLPDTIEVARGMMAADIGSVFVVHDVLEIIWLTDRDGAVQPLLWPMRMHVHSQDCGRT